LLRWQAPSAAAATKAIADKWRLWMVFMPLREASPVQAASENAGDREASWALTVGERGGSE
jgi:hypothetical protein